MKTVFKITIMILLLCSFEQGCISVHHLSRVSDRVTREGERELIRDINKNIESIARHGQKTYTKNFPLREQMYVVAQRFSHKGIIKLIDYKQMTIVFEWK